ncbi:MAG: hypothetical protein WC222_12500 [Parachlamydiales bacterium]
MGTEIYTVVDAQGEGPYQADSPEAAALRALGQGVLPIHTAAEFPALQVEAKGATTIVYCRRHSMEDWSVARHPGDL